MVKEKKPLPRLGWSIPRLALALDVSDQFVRKEIAAGRLKAIRIGDRRLLVADVEVQRYLKTAAAR